MRRHRVAYTDFITRCRPLRAKCFAGYRRSTRLSPPLLGTSRRASDGRYWITPTVARTLLALLIRGRVRTRGVIWLSAPKLMGGAAADSGAHLADIDVRRALDLPVRRT